MRATTNDRVVAGEPGSAVSVTVEVVNTGEVIDGISAHVIGLPAECVTAEPGVLPLFPSARGSITLTIAVPPAYPAGRHQLTVEVVSHGARVPAQHLDVDLEVAPHPAMTMTPAPRVIRARRSGRFALAVTNTGNVPLDVALDAADVDRASKVSFAPNQVRVEPGVTTPVLMHLRGPRMITGAEADRPVTVTATPARADIPADAEPDPSAPVLAPSETLVKLRQRPLLSRGMTTALVLLTIVGMWAAVFLLGLTKVFSNDPMTKAAPASFFAATQNAGSGANNAAGNAAGGSDAGGAPAGALPKTGQLPAGIGGEITGTVTSASTEQPVAQILVQAFRTKDGTPVSSAATQADGSYTLGGLFPSTYYLRFRAAGFRTVWYPSAPSAAGARGVSAAAQGTTSGVNALIRGLPASISGSVDPGDVTTSVLTTVTARPLDVAGGNAMSRVVTTSGDGKYHITGLAAPASYQLTFATPGYQTSTLQDSVSGGDTRLEPSVTLGAAQGAISGIVVNGNTRASAPIGGATVTTTVGGKTVTVMTPTAGAVGTFTIPNLPTPGTYVLNYSAPGHGTWTQVIPLRAGENRNTALGQLSAGTGSVTGTVYAGNTTAGLGGVTVTVGGALASQPDGTTPSAGLATPTTTTLTAGTVGGFYLNGLSDGDYTLTFSLAGYSSASVPLQLHNASTAPQVKVRLFKQSGEITGMVRTGSGDGLVGATITATDGRKTYTATSTAPGGQYPAGGYDIAGLPPGTYSVTATNDGYVQQTRLVSVGRGAVVTDADLRLVKAKRTG